MKGTLQLKELKDISQIINGGTPKTGTKEYWDGNIFWITPKDLGKLSEIFITNTERKITSLGLQKSSAKLLPINSLILSSRAPIGHLAITKVPISTNQGCKGIVVDEKNNNVKYVFYFLKKSVDLLNDLGSGTTFKEISGTTLGKVKIPIPSLNEQQAIVEKLDFAFDAIEKAKANIEKNIENAKELFQSKLNKIFSIENIKNGEVKTLKEITTILGDGLHGTPQYDINGNYHFINGNNLINEHIVFKESTKKVNEEEYTKYRKNLTNRTILVSINGTLGNVAFYNDEMVILGKSACYFNIVEGIDKRYIMYQFKNPKFIKYAHKEATGATIKNVSLKSMRNFNVVLPETLKEQEKIVAQLDSLSEQTILLQEKYKQKLANLEKLKKSILEKAFKGELV